MPGCSAIPSPSPVSCPAAATHCHCCCAGQSRGSGEGAAPQPGVTRALGSRSKNCLVAVRGGQPISLRDNQQFLPSCCSALTGKPGASVGRAGSWLPRHAQEWQDMPWSGGAEQVQGMLGLRDDGGGEAPQGTQTLDGVGDDWLKGACAGGSHEHPKYPQTVPANSTATPSPVHNHIQ